MVHSPFLKAFRRDLPGQWLLRNKKLLRGANRS